MRRQLFNVTAAASFLLAITLACLWLLNYTGGGKCGINCTHANRRGHTEYIGETWADGFSLEIHTTELLPSAPPADAASARHAWSDQPLLHAERSMQAERLWETTQLDPPCGLSIYSGVVGENYNNHDLGPVFGLRWRYEDRTWSAPSFLEDSWHIAILRPRIVLGITLILPAVWFISLIRRRLGMATVFRYLPLLWVAEHRLFTVVSVFSLVALKASVSFWQAHAWIFSEWGKSYNPTLRVVIEAGKIIKERPQPLPVPFRTMYQPWITVSRMNSMRQAVIAVLAFAIPPLIWVISFTSVMVAYHRRVSRRDCLRCGYRLSGNTSGVCPECGTPVPLAEIDCGVDARQSTRR